MKKYILAFFCVLSLNAEFIEEFTLKKDELKTINLFVENTHKILAFRWTLYKDNALILHLNYDKNPHQATLLKENLNSFKIPLTFTNHTKTPTPHIVIYFIDYDDYKKEAKFRYYLYRFDNHIEIM